MTTIDFTKIKFAGEDFIMVTKREDARIPIILLDRLDIMHLNKEWINSEDKGE